MICLAFIFPLPYFGRFANADDVSLQDIANSASISRSEASRCFQSYLHTSPVNYLLKYCVERSMQLLRDSNMTVEAVALECGFSSSAYFCKLFMTHTGMTPKQYRSTWQTYDII